MTDWNRLHLLAERHHGVVTSAMVRSVGIDVRAFRRRIERDHLRQILHGAYLLPGAPMTPLAKCSAALLLLGERAVLSHATAGFLHGLLGAPPSTVAVTVPADRNPAPRAGLQIVRSSTLLTGDVVQRRPLRLTAPPRTLRDLAGGRPDAAVLDLLTTAEQRRLVTLDDLVAQAERPGRERGAGTFRRCVETRRRDRADSGLERDTVTACRRHGFRPHDGPFPVRCPDGRRIHLDVAFPDIWFAIECDGLAFHRDAAAFERDRLRWRQAQAAGWRLTWVTRQRLLTDLPGLIAEVREAHRAAPPDRRPALPA